jgi:hypothetical protein
MLADLSDSSTATDALDRGVYRRLLQAAGSVGVILRQPLGLM